MNNNNKPAVSFRKSVADEAAVSGAATFLVAGIADMLDWYDGKIRIDQALSLTSADVLNSCRDGAVRGAALETVQRSVGRVRKFLSAVPAKNTRAGIIRAAVMRRIVSGQIYVAANLLVDVAGVIYNQGSAGLSWENLRTVARSSSFKSLAAFAVADLVAVMAGPVVGKFASGIYSSYIARDGNGIESSIV